MKKATQQTGIEQVRLADIVIDLSIRTREPERYTIAIYRQALKAGTVFPPMVLERETKRLVCGHHRYGMYRLEYDPEELVPCLLESYPSELALWERAVADNAEHGRPLDTWDKKRIALQMERLGGDKEKIASLLGVSVGRLEDWAGMSVVVIGQRDGQLYEHREPVKHGMEALIDGRIDEAQYAEEVVKNGTGVNVRRHAFALRRLLRNNWIEDDARVLAELRLLYRALGEWLKERATKQE